MKNTAAKFAACHQCGILVRLDESGHLAAHYGAAEMEICQAAGATPDPGAIITEGVTV